jgi:hypothetical protein
MVGRQDAVISHGCHGWLEAVLLAEELEPEHTSLVHTWRWSYMHPVPAKELSDTSAAVHSRIPRASQRLSASANVCL